ncbi:hypothetical protein T484DRAFT_1825338 [Baffinella frigidus]|nr:hypothetical protein T484DRAFT_1825338 [Cryptophyta sp. CCMP2293]
MQEAATRRGAARAEARFLGLTFAGTAIETAEAEALARVEAPPRMLAVLEYIWSPQTAIETAEAEALARVEAPPRMLAVLEYIWSPQTAIETAEAEALARVEARIRGLSKDERKGCCAKFLDELEPFTLAAYLRNARSDEEEAVRRLLASAEWREGFGASSLLEDASFEIDRFFGDGTREVEWLPAEADQTALGRGNPVLLYRSASHAPLGRPTEDWVRFFVYQCEKVRRDTPDKQVRR